MMIPGTERAGLRGIRGSIYRQLGWINDAVSEYEAVLKLRKSNPSSSEAEIGEAMSELGFAYLKQWHLRKGLAYCKDGVDLLRQGARSGFLSRGLRKLAAAYLCNGRLIDAYEAKREARTVAVDHGAYDQL